LLIICYLNTLLIITAPIIYMEKLLEDIVAWLCRN